MCVCEREREIKRERGVERKTNECIMVLLMTRLRADAPEFVPSTTTNQNAIRLQQQQSLPKTNDRKATVKQRTRRKQQKAAATTKTLPPQQQQQTTTPKKTHRSSAALGRNRFENNNTTSRRRNKIKEHHPGEKNRRLHCGSKKSKTEHTDADEHDGAFDPTYTVFPALTAENSVQPKAAAVSSSTGIDGDSSFKQAVIAPPAVTTTTTRPNTSSEDDDDDNGMMVLRPLRREPKEKMRRSSTVRQAEQQCRHEHESSEEARRQYDEDSVPARATTTTRPKVVQRQRRITDMTKLRDRWWGLLRKRSNEKLQQQQQLAPQVVENDDAALLRQSRRRVVDEEEQNNGCCFESSVNVVDVVDDDVNGNIKSTTLFDLQAQDDDDDDDSSSTTTSFSCSDDDDSSCYYANHVELHEAVQRNDAVTLKRLLHNKARVADGSSSSSGGGRSSSSTPTRNEYDPPPLLLAAAECGFEECLQILLADSSGASSPLSLLSTTRDSEGNTALHCCCRGEATLACNTFNLLLDYAVTSAASTSSSSCLFKILSCKNNQQQTPLHVACQYGQTEIVDAILTHRSTATASMSVLSKLFSLQDSEQQTPLLAAVASGSTDIVMSLLMWRGNNNHAYYKRTTQLSSLSHGVTNHTSNCNSSSGGRTDAAPPPCPLIWAIRAMNVDMVQLLLEFNDPLSGSGYNLNTALHVAVNNSHHHKEESSGSCSVSVDGCDDDGNIRSEIVRILVDAGANPCAVQQDETARHTTGRARSSVLAVAATHHDSACLVALLDSYRLYLDRIQSSRRRDPKLQKQPESFFAGMESVENAEMKSATREALVVALFHAWKTSSSSSTADAGSQSSSSSAYIACALALYRRGVRLLQPDMARLKTSLVENTLKSMDSISVPPPSCQYEACYPRIVGSCRKEKDKETELHYLSRLMFDLPWFATYCTNTRECAWSATQSVMENISRDDVSFSEPDIVLICQDGERFQAHSFVLSRSSDKLAAAIRFASMCREQSDGGEPRPAALTEIQVDLTATTCQRILEHMYHGSIGGGLSSDRHEACQELLELLLVAEEFLCRSLVQECEMRLLSSEQYSHGCFCCYCRAKAGQIKTEPHMMKTVECFYRVSGPSWLVTPAEALDVLAVVQHVSEACCETDFSLRIVSSNTESSMISPLSSNYRMKGIIQNSLDALREVALFSILSDFDAVARSSAFASHFEDMLENRTSKVYAQDMLLRMSLQDLSEVGCSSQGSQEAKPSGPVKSATSSK